MGDDATYGVPAGDDATYSVPAGDDATYSGTEAEAEVVQDVPARGAAGASAPEGDPWASVLRLISVRRAVRRHPQRIGGCG